MNILMKLNGAIKSTNQMEKESTSPLGLFGRGIGWSDPRNTPFHSSYLQRQARARLLMQ